MKRFGKSPAYTVGLALISALIGGAIGATLHKETVVVRESTPNTPAAMSSINLMVDFGNGEVRTWNTVSWHEAMSVLNTLETIAMNNGLVLNTDDKGDNNVTVTSINGVANDKATNMRWQYWINNTYEPRIASKYYIKPSDIIVWKYVVEQPK